MTILKRFQTVLMLPIAVTFLMNCGEKSKPGTENCTYSYNEAGTGVTWTAYKFTERAGVSGRFNKITLTETHVAANPAKVFEGARFSIDPADINSDNPGRDKKIRESFFGSMKDGGVITGYINDVDYKSQKGSARVKINGVEKDIPLAFEIGKDGTIEAKGVVDMKDYNAIDAISALNKVCEDLHTGKDGISKLWPDISLKLTAKVNSECKG